MLSRLAWTLFMAYEWSGGLSSPWHLWVHRYSSYCCLSWTSQVDGQALGQLLLLPERSEFVEEAPGGRADIGLYTVWVLCNAQSCALHSLRYSTQLCLSSFSLLLAYGSPWRILLFFSNFPALTQQQSLPSSSYLPLVAQGTRAGMRKTRS